MQDCIAEKRRILESGVDGIHWVVGSGETDEPGRRGGGLAQARS